MLEYNLFKGWFGLNLNLYFFVNYGSDGEPVSDLYQQLS